LAIELAEAAFKAALIWLLVGLFSMPMGRTVVGTATRKADMLIPLLPEAAVGVVEADM